MELKQMIFNLPEQKESKPFTGQIIKHLNIVKQPQMQKNQRLSIYLKSQICVMLIQLHIKLSHIDTLMLISQL